MEVRLEENAEVDTSLIVTKKDISANIDVESEVVDCRSPLSFAQKIDLRCAPRTWRTTKDPFEDSWDEIRLRLEIMPETNAKMIVPWFMEKYPNRYNEGQM